MKKPLWPERMCNDHNRGYAVCLQGRVTVSNKYRDIQSLPSMVLPVGKHEP